MYKVLPDEKETLAAVCYMSIKSHSVNVICLRIDGVVVFLVTNAQQYSHFRRVSTIGFTMNSLNKHKRHFFNVF